MNPDKIPESALVRKIRLLFEAEGYEQGWDDGWDDGRAEGRAEGRQDALLMLLQARGLTVSCEDEARIRACADTTKLDRWLLRVTTASTVREVLGAKSSAPAVRRRSAGRSRSPSPSRA